MASRVCQTRGLACCIITGLHPRGAPDDGGTGHVTDGITQVRLDDGTVVWARISEAQELRTRGAGGDGGAYQDSSGYQGSDGHQGSGGYQDSGAARRVAQLASGMSDVVRGVVGSLRMGLAAARPQEVKVEFGIELSAQSGQVISMIADGGGKASVNVTLTWTEGGPGEGGAGGDAGGGDPGTPVTPSAP